MEYGGIKRKRRGKERNIERKGGKEEEGGRKITRNRDG